MKHRSQPNSPKCPKVSPWVVGMAILGAIILAGIMFNRDYRREQGHLEEIFQQRGEVLIHSLEMVGRVRKGQRWEEGQLLTFWNHLEPNDNVLFLAVTDGTGEPVVTVGKIKPEAKVFANPLAPSFSQGPITPASRLENIDGRLVYLVYRPFWPTFRRLNRQGGMHHKGQRGFMGYNEKHALPPPDPGQSSQWTPQPQRYLWVGFDLSPYEKDSDGRVLTAGIFIALFCLAGLGGVLALIWGHSSRLARQMYQDTNAMATALIGRLPTAVILKDVQGRVTLVNEATISISGVQEKEFLGQTLEELTFGQFPMDSTMTAREMSLNFLGGNQVRVALTSGPVINDDGHPLGQVILMEDLGELGWLKAELAKKEKLAALGSLAAGLAHEIRNPLGAIRGLSQHLLSKKPPDPTDRQALEVMLASVDRLNATITDFLDFARPTVVKISPLDLVELLSNMATLAGHDARSQAVELKLELPQPGVFIEGDEALLSQAFLNLYLNAIEAAASGGQGGQLKVALKVYERQARLTFHDNGRGFSPEQLAQPFVPYFTTKASGTGLGLALVEKTIRAHQGADIALTSPPSGGGMVTITFKLQEKNNHES